MATFNTGMGMAPTLRTLQNCLRGLDLSCKESVSKALSIENGAAILRAEVASYHLDIQRILAIVDEVMIPLIDDVGPDFGFITGSEHSSFFWNREPRALRPAAPRPAVVSTLQAAIVLADTKLNTTVPDILLAAAQARGERVIGLRLTSGRAHFHLPHAQAEITLA